MVWLVRINPSGLERLKGKIESLDASKGKIKVRSKKEHKGAESTKCVIF